MIWCPVTFLSSSMSPCTSPTGLLTIAPTLGILPCKAPVLVASCLECSSLIYVWLTPLPLRGFSQIPHCNPHLLPCFWHPGHSSPFLFLFYHKTHRLLTYDNLFITLLCIIRLSPIKKWGKHHCLCWVYLKNLQQWLEHRRVSVHICWMVIFASRFLIANPCPQQADLDIQSNPFFRFNEGAKSTHKNHPQMWLTWMKSWRQKQKGVDSSNTNSSRLVVRQSFHFWNVLSPPGKAQLFFWSF